MTRTMFIPAGGGAVGVSIPLGAIWQWPTDTPPTGFLICDGSAISRLYYADLFALIGTTFGIGNGITTFNLPDLRDRVVVGGSGTKSIADMGGEETHTLTEDEMPAHTHNEYRLGAGTAASAASPRTLGNVAATTGSTGGDQAHNNMQPYCVLHYIIRVA
jgi:microcystin-dependent protein